MKKIFVLHPFLVGMCPVFFLYAYNLTQATLPEIAQPLIFIISVTLILEIVLYFILKNKRKASLLVSFFLFIFLTYGVFRNFLNIEADKYFLPFWLILFVVGVIIILKLKTDFIKITTFLNVTAAALYIVPVINIAAFVINGKDVKSYKVNDISFSTRAISKDSLPNIYEILLDAYGSSSTLKEYYYHDFDNSGFENYLSKLGFHIIPNFRSNYAETRLSLASFLNMRHLYKMRGKLNSRLLQHLIQTNAVMRILKSSGYKIVYINSNYGEIRSLKCADLNVRYGSFLADEFATKLINFSMLGAISEYLGLDFVYFYREKILNALSAITEVNERIREPVFVFAHIMSPHPPYVFGPNANDRLNFNWDKLWSEKEKYIGQLIFVNSEIEKIVSRLLLKDPSSIILIHGDHGPYDPISNDHQITTKMHPFFAYYLPPGTEDFLKNTKTLVNIFPSIFNKYFGADISLLEDKSFFTNYYMPRNFRDVTDMVDYK